MSALQSHRGPGAFDLWVGPGVGLCCQEPVRRQRWGVVAEGPHHMVCDTEINSLPAVTAAVDVAPPVPAGVRAFLRSLVASGTEGLRRLEGPFAVAIWNDAERRLVLGRDRLGVRPLYYLHAPDGTLFFATQIKALLAAEAVRPAVNRAALSDYLATGAPIGGATMFEGIRRVPPAHALIWQDGRIRLEQYWRLEFNQRSPEPVDRVLERLAVLLRRSVGKAVGSGGQVGVLGTDGPSSAALVALARELSLQPVETLTWAFGPQQNGRRGQVRLAPDAFFASIPAVVWHEDEPLASPLSVALFHLYERAAERVDIVLTDVGGEELVGGGRREPRTVAALRLAAAYNGLGVPALRATIERMLTSTRRSGPFLRRLTPGFVRHPADCRTLYLERSAIFGVTDRDQLLAADVREQGAGLPYAGFQDLLDDVAAHRLLDDLLAVDMLTSLHERLMVHGQASAATGVVVRMPFLDPTIVDCAARFPARLKLRRRGSSHALVRSMGDLLAGEVSRHAWSREPPLAKWFRGPLRALVHEYVLSDRALARGLLRADAVGHLVAAHESGRADHASRLWLLINLEIWQRLFLDGDIAGAEAPRTTAVAG
jgi:asparagine synthase (glutamine-hydrolysing)